MFGITTKPLQFVHSNGNWWNGASCRLHPAGTLVRLVNSGSSTTNFTTAEKRREHNTEWAVASLMKEDWPGWTSNEGVTPTWTGPIFSESSLYRARPRLRSGARTARVACASGGRR